MTPEAAFCLKTILWNGVFLLFFDDFCFRQSKSSYMEKSDRPLLSEMELRIIRLIAEGYTSQEIADEVFLSLNTIKWYRKRLKIKLGAPTTVQLVRRAMEDGLV